jgi:Flp pilus assembly protein TadG
MRDAKPLRSRYGPARHQIGAAAVEFAILVIIFLLFVFIMMETARAMYLFNTLQEVTRRAAATAASSNYDADTLADTRSNALFKDRDGNLLLGAPVTPSHLKIGYFSLERDSTSGAVSMKEVTTLPDCPVQNRANCTADPNGANCIRFVKVQICEDDGSTDCTAVPYEPLFPLVNLAGLKLPRSTTIVPAESLGHTPSSTPCS